jgi:hypothetical protein
MFKFDVASLDIAEVSEPASKGIKVRLLFVGIARVPQNTDRLSYR